MIEFPVSAGIQGRFTVEKRKGGVITEARTFSNIILHNGVTEILARFRTGNAWQIAEFLFLGTSPELPTRNNPGLLEPSAIPGKQASSHSFSNFMDPQYGERWAEATLKYDYAVGEATGEWYEFGTALDAGYTVPCNRALVRDENDQPNPLVVLADEALSVTLTFRVSEGLQFPRKDRFYLNQEREYINYTLSPMDSTYWYTSENPWNKGWANETVTVLGNGNSTSMLRYKIGPWPSRNADQTLAPVVTTTHDKAARSTTYTVALQDSDQDVSIEGLAFGPSTAESTWMYKLMFDTPLVKAAFNSISFSLTLAFSVNYPDLPWDLADQ